MRTAPLAMIAVITMTITIASAMTPAVAQESTSGEIIVHTHSGPGAPADPTIRLFRNGSATDLWSASCGPAPGQPGYTLCDGLAEGTYTFGLAEAPPGTILSPSCTYQSVNGEFFPVNVGSAPTGAWTWEWACELFVGLPGVIVRTPLAEIPPPSVAFDGAPPACTTVELHEGDTVLWCGAPAVGEWTIEPPPEADGWTVTPKCEPIGTYFVPGYPLESFTFTTTIEDPMWRCRLEYRQDQLVWYVVAEPGTPEAAYVDAPWQLIDVASGEDMSAQCSESEPLGLGELVGYECAVPVGLYSVVIEGFAPDQGISACTEVYVQDVTYCSALEVLSTSASYLLWTWAAPGEMWPDAVAVELLLVRAASEPANAPTPLCRTVSDEVYTQTETAVGREQRGECVQIVPGTYSFALSGAPTGAAVETIGCDSFELTAGQSWQCSISIRTVDPPDDPGAEEPSTDGPGATLPPTGTSTSEGIALGGTIALALGVSLLVGARHRTVTGRGGAGGR